MDNAKNIIDLHDVQGNIMVNFAGYGCHKSRYFFLHISNAAHGRMFIKNITGLVSTAAFMAEKDEDGLIIPPLVTTNIAFTYNGLKELGIPTLTLQDFPDEFVVGIRNRASILGDDLTSAPEKWDAVYRKDIHLFISIDGANEALIEERYQQIKDIIDDSLKECKEEHLVPADQASGIKILDGCRDDESDNKAYQDASVVYEEVDGQKIPTAKEHFGYTDGISNPFFKGMTPEMGEVLGGGKRVGYGSPKSPASWEPIETGEFILGYKDEANEYPAAPIPKLFSKNGSYLVFNKFHENVGKYHAYLDAASQKYDIEKELLAAKYVGRWRNGAPLTTYPKKADAEDAWKVWSAAQWQVGKLFAAIMELKGKIATEQDPAKKDLLIQEKKKLLAEYFGAAANFKVINQTFTAFNYDDDIPGSKCPVGAHMRRANPRGALEFGNKNAFATPSALDNRRRIIRRGLPYGVPTLDSNDKEHGTIIMTIVSNIKRQFEFVIQQWLNYGNDFKLANDKDPITGNMGEEGGQMVIEGNPALPDDPAKFLLEIPRFVETRGGVYLFLPSITSLNMIGKGIVDPT